MSNAKTFGQAVARLRKDKRLTQVDLAAAIGVSRSTIAGIERGNDMPGRETLTALSDFFGIPMDRLRHGMVGPRPPRQSQIVDDPDELALIEFWRGLTDDQRRFMLGLLNVPTRRDSAA